MRPKVQGSCQVAVPIRWLSCHTTARKERVQGAGATRGNQNRNRGNCSRREPRIQFTFAVVAGTMQLPELREKAFPNFLSLGCPFPFCSAHVCVCVCVGKFDCVCVYMAATSVTIFYDCGADVDVTALYVGVCVS